ncbi:MAG: tetratricopeptide repeat protein [Candidatus Limnocylindria bacterium]
MTTSPLNRPRLRTRPLTFAAAALAVVASTYLVSALVRVPAPSGPGAPALAGRDAPALSVPGSASAAGSDVLLAAIDHEIGLWRQSLEQNQGNFIAAGALGSLYLQRGRITGDLGDYSRALEAAERSIAADPIYWQGHALRASVLFALHDFAAALAEAQTTFEADPEQLDALAVAGDASLELGDVAAAEDAYARLSELAPSPPVWSRLAHLAFIRGDPEQGIDLVMRCLAATLVAEEPAAAAFYQFQLGDLYRSSGALDGASAAFEASLAALDGYVPALSGLAHVREAQGRRDEAITLLEQATARQPLPEMVAALGDLYALAGDTGAAERQYALVERIGAVGQATGTVYDRQLIVFAADHGRGLEAAIQSAAAGLEVRHDVYGFDAYAWALYRAGRVDEAADAAAAALALGTPDPRILYHAGMIAAANRRIDEARMMLEQAVRGRAALPPLQAVEAVEALEALP